MPNIINLKDEVSAIIPEAEKIYNDFKNPAEIFAAIMKLPDVKNYFDALEKIGFLKRQGEPLKTENTSAVKKPCGCGSRSGTGLTPLKRVTGVSPQRLKHEEFPPAKVCLLCAKKHLRYALAVIPELLNGYADDSIHLKLLEGNLIASEQHIVAISQEIAGNIRELRLRIFEKGENISDKIFFSLLEIDNSMKNSGFFDAPLLGINNMSTQK